jgi:hypothetical protein
MSLGSRGSERIRTRIVRAREGQAGGEEGAVVVAGGIEIDEGAEVGIDGLESVGGNSKRSQEGRQGREAKGIGGEELSDRVDDSRAAVEGGEGMEAIGDEGDSEVVRADERDQEVDPARGEEGGVGGGRISEGNGVGEGLQAGGERREGAEAGDGVADDRDMGWQRREILAGRGDNDDGPGGLGDEPDDAREEPLGAEGEPGLGLAHPAALAAAKDDGARFHGDIDPTGGS